MRTLLAHLASAGLLVLTAGARAGELADAAATAERQVAQGQFLEAMTTMSEAQDKVWQQSPLLFRKTVFVASDPRGFGNYDPHEGSSFKRTDPVTLYVEPVGFGYRKDGEMQVIDLSLDFTVKNKKGRQIGAQKSFANPQLRSRVQNREFFLKVVYDFSAAPAGDYEVTTTVNDKASGKSGSFTLPLTLTK
jgi:hypothetical protein